MSKKSPDYSNTIIYKICCKNENVKDLYVGHTTDFIGRKYSHKKRCKKLENNEKIYETIRNNGGWENWNMVEIARYCCENRTEARIKESEHYIELEATLNTNLPYVDREIYSCSICEFKCDNIKNYKDHVFHCTKKYNKRSKCFINNVINEEENISEENLIKQDTIEENPDENKEKYENSNHICISCNYSTNRKSNFERHLLSSKHINSKITNKSYNCDICNKSYDKKSSLYKHNIRHHPDLSDKNKINKLTKMVKKLENVIKNNNRQIEIIHKSCKF